MIAEIAISTIDNIVDKKRIQVGDITTVRKPTSGIGFKEMRTFIWLRVSGLSFNKMLELCSPEYLNEKIVEKKRFRILLGRLAQVEPFFNINLAKNPQIIYQPFLPIDASGLFLSPFTAKVYSVFGLVSDKQTAKLLRRKFLKIF